MQSMQQTMNDAMLQEKSQTNATTLTCPGQCLVDIFVDKQ